MNRTQVSLADAVGKTIEVVITTADGSAALVAFTDATFCMVSAARCYEDVVLEFEETNKFYHTYFSDDDLAKVFSAETLASWADEDEKAAKDRARRQELYEHQQYEEYKKKFG